MLRPLWLACLLVILLAVPLRAEISVGGPVAAATTWRLADSPVLVTSDVTIDNGATLTIEAGVTVRFQSGRRLTVHNGALKALGTAAAPVFFTSWRDNGSDVPAPGDWDGLEFRDGTLDAATLLQNAKIMYGSTSILRGAAPTFNSCHFLNNSGPALDMDLFSFPHGSGNLATGNGRNAIRVPAGEMTASGSWDLTGIPYYLEGEVSVGAAPTISGISPQNMEQASTVNAVITGTRLSGARSVTFSDPGISAAIQAGGSATSLPLQVTVAASVPLGATSFVASVAAGEISSPLGVTITPPLPQISGLTPNRVYVNRPTLPVDIAGKNFVETSVAELAGTPLVTRYVSPTLLQADLPSQLVAALRQMTVKNPDPRASGAYLTSNPATFTVELPQFSFTPTALTVRQGEASTGLTLAIPFSAPPGGLTVNLASSNTQAATVPASVTIPEGMTSTTVEVTAPNSATTHDVTLDVTAYQNNWLSNKATVTVKPEPTVNLSPVTLLSGQGFTFFLTITLTDPAPAGGLVVDLSAAPANVVTLPPSVTITAGATQAQVTVTNSNPGSATISAAPAVGKGFTAGDNCSVTIRPVQLTGVNPLVSQPVGVQFGSATGVTTRDVSYTPLTSRPVGITLGPVITGVSPDRAPLGTQNLLVRVNGSGLTAASAISVSPTGTGATVHDNSLFAAPDGSYVEFRLDIAADATVSDRIVTVTANGVAVPAASVHANRFQVTWPQPELWSIITNNAVAGSAMTLQLSGRYFQGASAISIEPPQGIQITIPPTVSTDGTSAGAQITISADAAPGERVVRIVTPGGSTPATPQIGNVFTIRSTPGTTYTPIVSQPVGVKLQTATVATSRDVTYTPLVSRQVGVILGTAMVSTTPSSGAIGTSDLTVRVNGYGLSGVDSFAIQPADGLTITMQPPAADGSWVEALVSIAANAPLTERVIVLKSGSTLIPAATVGANRFRVTLPQPEISSIAPNRREVGSSFTLTLNGRLLAGATAISFEPATGITVVNPPTVSSDGTQATVTVIIAANAPTGQRVVTITTPGGTTSATPTINTFLVTDLAGTTYAGLTSLPVGVKLATATPPVDHDVSYGPVVSAGVGVMLTPAAPPTEGTSSYTPLVSRPVGVAFGAVLTALSHTFMEPGTSTTLTVSGFGLDAVTGASLAPADGITLGTATAAPDGRSLTIPVTIDPAAPRMARAILLTTASGPVSAPARVNTLYVGFRPLLTSLSPSLETVGTSFTLTINGNNLDGATRVRFEPSDGIAVASTLAVNAGGTQATVSIILDGMATGSQRVVIVEGPYGASSSISVPGNTFTVYNPSTSGAAPAQTRYAAGKPALEPETAGWQTSQPVPELLTYMDSVPKALPVVRKIMNARTSEGIAIVTRETHPPTVPQTTIRQHEPLQLYSGIGWGYRAPPSLDSSAPEQLHPHTLKYPEV